MINIQYTSTGVHILLSMLNYQESQNMIKMFLNNLYAIIYEDGINYLSS